VLRPELEFDIEPLIYGFNPSQREAQRSGPSLFDMKPVAPGSYQSGAIVLISDGRRTTGPDPIAAAQLAAQLGVRVYTVAFGTPDGFIPGFEGRSFYAAVDERTLQAMALLTEGEFFKAENSQELANIYQQLSAQLELERGRTEISALFAGASTLLVLLASLLSIYWFRRSHA